MRKRMGGGGGGGDVGVKGWGGKTGIKGGVEEKFVVKRYDCGLITCYITEPKQSFIKHYIRSNNGTYTKNYLNLKDLIFHKYL